ncbi:STAS domain-containing protein [Streptomyces sp. NPDC003042]
MEPVESDFRIMMRRYGPTVHLTLTGELDLEARPAFARVRGALTEGVAVVACDMHHVPFMDVTGLNCLLSLGEHAQSRGMTLLVYNWQQQPLHLLDLFDSLERRLPVSSGNGRGLASRALRDTVRDRADTRRDLGIDGAVEDRSPVGATESALHPGPPPGAARPR